MAAGIAVADMDLSGAHHQIAPGAFGLHRQNNRLVDPMGSCNPCSQLRSRSLGGEPGITPRQSHGPVQTNPRRARQQGLKMGLRQIERRRPTDTLHTGLAHRRASGFQVLASVKADQSWKTGCGGRTATARPVDRTASACRGAMSAKIVDRRGSGSREQTRAQQRCDIAGVGVDPARLGADMVDAPAGGSAQGKVGATDVVERQILRAGAGGQGDCGRCAKGRRARQRLASAGTT